jgi:hypothetical protein
VLRDLLPDTFERVGELDNTQVTNGCIDMAVGYNVNIDVKDPFKTGIFIVQCTNSTWSSWLKATGVLNRAGTTFSSRDKPF